MAAGIWLDGVLGTKPWLAFVGFFLGLAAGVLNVYRVMQLANKQMIARDRARHGASRACAIARSLFRSGNATLAAPLGVLGGGLLIGLSFWAIRGTVDTLIASRLSDPSGETRPEIPPRFALVKFFTRHAIVALAAYGMMVRLHLDPVGLLAGVSSLGVAVGVEALRDLRWRRFL